MGMNSFYGFMIDILVLMNFVYLWITYVCMNVDIPCSISLSPYIVFLSIVIQSHPFSQLVVLPCQPTP